MFPPANSQWPRASAGESRHFGNTASVSENLLPFASSVFSIKNAAKPGRPGVKNDFCSDKVSVVAAGFGQPGILKMRSNAAAFLGSAAGSGGPTLKQNSRECHRCMLTGSRPPQVWGLGPSYRKLGNSSRENEGPFHRGLRIIPQYSPGSLTGRLDSQGASDL
jgi:hypothetical protein